MLCHLIGFSFVKAAVPCEIIVRISGFEPSSETTASREVLKACNGTQVLPFYLYLPLGAICAEFHQCGLFSTDLHLIPCAGFVETYN